MPSLGMPFSSLFFLISMPSGLLDPVVCKAVRCNTTKPASAKGTAMT